MTRHVLCPAVCLFAAAAGSACVEPARSMGYVEVALTAPGPDGSTYRLPFDTLLVFDRPEFHGVFSLADDVPSKTLQVPPGDYALSLVDHDGDTAVWPLILEDADGRTTTVPTSLDLPAMLRVTEDQTTALVIRFHIPNLEPITFSVGSVDVSVAVDVTPATSIDLEVGVLPGVLVPFVGFSGPSTPAALRPRLTATGDRGDGYLVSMHVVGPWAIVSENVVCAPATASIRTGGNPGFVNLIAEAPPLAAQPLCLRQDAPGLTQVSMRFTRQGASTTPLLADLGAPQYSVSHGLFATVDGADVFDGRTLHLDAIAGVHAVQFGMFAEVSAQIGTRPDGAPVTEQWYEVNEAGVVAMVVAPR